MSKYYLENAGLRLLHKKHADYIDEASNGFENVYNQIWIRKSNMNDMSLKNKLKECKASIGSWISLGNQGIAEILCDAGFEWIVIDLEHSAITLDIAADLIRVIDLKGTVPLVRLTSNDSNQIKRVMDAGAHGIVVPMVNTIDDAKYAIESTRYEPIGKRGVGLEESSEIWC